MPIEVLFEGKIVRVLVVTELAISEPNVLWYILVTPRQHVDKYPVHKKVLLRKQAYRPLCRKSLVDTYLGRGGGIRTLTGGYPTLARMGYPPPPPGVDRQTETITFPHPSDAGGKYYLCNRFLANRKVLKVWERCNPSFGT